MSILLPRKVPPVSHRRQISKTVLFFLVSKKRINGFNDIKCLIRLCRPVDKSSVKV